MKLQEFIDATCESLELSGLTPDTEGNYVIVFDGTVEIEIVPKSGTRLILRSRLASIPDDPQEHEAFLRSNLQRNLANLHSQQGALTIDHDAGCLWMYRQVDIQSLDPTIVADLVEDFVNLSDWWSQSDSSHSPVLTPMGMLRP